MYCFITERVNGIFDFLCALVSSLGACFWTEAEFKDLQHLAHTNCYLFFTSVG